MAENEWTDDLKQQVVESYEAAEPTPETTMDIVKELAEEFEKTPNGIRMILTKAGVYVKKTVSSSSGTSKASSGTKRISKADAIGSLKTVIEAAGKEVDHDICDRLTGKAAVYIAGLLSK